MYKTIAQHLAHEQVRDNHRAANSEWCGEHVYKATVRRFASGCEISIRDVQADRIDHPVLPEVPIHLQIPKERTEEEQAERDAENMYRAAKRAKQAVRWLLKSMQADHLLTLTTRADIGDLKKFQRIYQEFVRLVRKRYPKWQYVAAHELQERGAIHLHIGIRGRGDVHWLRRCWWIALGHRVEIDYNEKGKPVLRALVKDGQWRYARPEEVRGNIDLRGPQRKFSPNGGAKWKTDKLAAYMTKYMAKNFDKVSGVRRYWPSKAIERPFVEQMWLMATEWRDAVREAHDMVKGRFCCSSLHIWHSPDMARMWFSGSEPGCPF